MSQLSECRWCKAKHSHVYDYSCPQCRQRALLAEPCKILRKHMAENMWRYGDVPEWKVEPHCGCKNHCKRVQLTRKNERIN